MCSLFTFYYFFFFVRLRFSFLKLSPSSLSRARAYVHHSIRIHLVNWMVNTLVWTLKIHIQCKSTWRVAVESDVGHWSSTNDQCSVNTLTHTHYRRPHKMEKKKSKCIHDKHVIELALEMFMRLYFVSLLPSLILSRWCPCLLSLFSFSCSFQFSFVAITDIIFERNEFKWTTKDLTASDVNCVSTSPSSPLSYMRCIARCVFASNQGVQFNQITYKNIEQNVCALEWLNIEWKILPAEDARYKSEYFENWYKKMQATKQESHISFNKFSHFLWARILTHENLTHISISFEIL